MMILSKRLQMVADMVPICEIAADVGTDHGYLAVWLIERGRAQRVLATDIHDGPIRRARQTAVESGLEAQIETHLCDGLQFPGAARAQTVVIAGMGGETMISILSKAPWTREGRTLVLQPQSKRAELEQWLQENGYMIEDAKLCKDAGKYYLALRAIGRPASEIMSAEHILLRKHDPLLPEVVRTEKDKLLCAIRQLEGAQRDVTDTLRAMRQRVAQLSMMEREIGTW